MSEENGRCTATTKSGNQCRNRAQSGSDRCHVHRAAGAAAFPEMQQLVAELDELVAELKTAVPDDGSSPYNPVHLLTAVRQNLEKLAPETQLGILQSFEGMSKEDLLDIETWKGLAYMMSYSARFQADQVRERMNEQLPKPLQPDTILSFVKQNVDRFTPDVAKEIMASFQGATKEDLIDPDTWKGLAYMINYSLQFQAEQFRQRLAGESEREDE